VQEAALLEEVAVQFSGMYEFVGPNNPSSKQFEELFDALVSVPQVSVERTRARVA
jgi:hypothetical protein